VPEFRILTMRKAIWNGSEIRAMIAVHLRARSKLGRTTNTCVFGSVKSFSSTCGTLDVKAMPGKSSRVVSNSGFSSASLISNPVTDSSDSRALKVRARTRVKYKFLSSVIAAWASASISASGSSSQHCSPLYMFCRGDKTPSERRDESPSCYVGAMGHGTDGANQTSASL
jgi:hypothetical protein